MTEQTYSPGDMVYSPDYGVGTVLSIIEEGTPITIYGDTFPNPSVLVGVEFAGTKMALPPEKVVKMTHVA